MGEKVVAMNTDDYTVIIWISGLPAVNTAELIVSAKARHLYTALTVLSERVLCNICHSKYHVQIFLFESCIFFPYAENNGF